MSDQTADEKSNTGQIRSYIAFGRQKFHEAVTATKESSYYRRVTEKLASVSSNQDPLIQIPIPDNAEIQLYATYARQTDDNIYEARVCGVLMIPGRMNRKNRMMLSLAKRMSRSSMPYNAADQFEDTLSDAIRHPNSSEDDQGDDSSVSSSSCEDLKVDTTVDDRMSTVIASEIPHALLKITVGPEVVSENVYTDEYGMFTACIGSTKPPTTIEVSSVNNPNVLQVLDIQTVSTHGFSVISDVDDTVRVTGVLGDKIDIFRNIFARPYADCVVPGVSSWIQQLHTKFGCSIHYVSNSPWQVYNIVHGFLLYDQLPITSISLKQYFGSILSTVRMDASQRKHVSLAAIMSDFPHRKFVLLGDSGEQDLEAYVSLCSDYGSQIMAIYIRALEGSFSSVGNDRKAVVVLQKMLDTRVGHSTVRSNRKPPPDVPAPASVQEDLIELEDAPALPPRHKKKLAPIVPHKPAALRGRPIQHLPEHKLHIKKVSHEDEYQDASEEIVHDALPHNMTEPIQHANSTSVPVSHPSDPGVHRVTSHHHLAWLNSSPLRETLSRHSSTANLPLTGTQQPQEDLKFENWKYRIQNAIALLPRGVDVHFWWKPADVMERSFELIRAEQKR